MKKINRLKDPFLHGAIVDAIGFTAIAELLIYNGCFDIHPFMSVGFLATLLSYVLFRSMFASVSLNLTRSIYLLRVIVFNINVDLKLTKIYISVFGDRNLYKRRIVLLRQKKKRAKKVYASVVKLTEVLWKSGYNPDALLLVLSHMVAISDELTNLSRGYRRKSHTK